jgi:hypothetical protein
MKTVAESNVASAEAYYTAMNNKDAARVANYLHPHSIYRADGHPGGEGCGS